MTRAWPVVPVIADPEPGGAAGAARIYELEVYDTTTASAPSAPAILCSGTNATGRVQRGARRCRPAKTAP